MLVLRITTFWVAVVIPKKLKSAVTLCLFKTLCQTRQSFVQCRLTSMKDANRVYHMTYHSTARGVQTYLHKNALCIGPRDSVHGIKGEAEVRLVQQRLEGIKVKDGAQ